ncbi:DUF1801 domain-containing protein [Candidatus Woesebacteria bacterium]|jgi:hypothetical protein|nr:DUF1801 domain-containing protein [Candidatus Woesebacteria bacterium]
MSEPKTKETNTSLTDFFHSLASEDKREDANHFVSLYEKQTGEKAVVWGTSIVGFGKYAVTKGKKQTFWPLLSFSPRKANFTLYGLLSVPENKDLLPEIGKHTVGGGCLYVEHYSDIDDAILGKMIKNAFTASSKEK